MKTSILINFVILHIVYCQTTINYSINTLYSSDGDLKISFLLKDCSKDVALESNFGRTLTNSAIWIVERLNLLQRTSPLTLGLTVFQICNDTDVYNTLFHIFQEHEKKYQIGIVNSESFSTNLIEFSQALELKTKYLHKYWKPLIKASIELLRLLNWKENVTIVTQFKDTKTGFYKFSRREWICVEKVINTDVLPLALSPLSPTVIFAENDVIKSIIKQLILTKTADWKIIVVSLEGKIIEDLLNGVYVIQPIYGDIIQTFASSPKIIPSPLFFDIAHPLISYANEIYQLLNKNCNGTAFKLNCLKNVYKYEFDHQTYAYSSLINFLKIQPLTMKFNYNIYKIENVSMMDVNRNKKKTFQSRSKLFSYNIFEESLEDVEETFDGLNFTNITLKEDCAKRIGHCVLSCLNFKNSDKNTIFFSNSIYPRSDSWIFAFISISVLGIIFCLAIIIFIFIRIFQKHIFEGNPTLTILLLIIVIIMYLSIIPFALDGSENVKDAIMSARSLCISLPYAAGFSLLLSRAILLATISKEVGFMSHVAGIVQSFLSMFIFGVQCALSLQVVRHCEDTFHNFFIMYLLSYNIILLLMLLCLTPMIARSQRNYKEGRYFTISSILITSTWCFWVPAYILLGDEWKDPLLCMGLVSTASILLGSLFIPRTYMMTVAAARDRFASALPSLATATSTMDIYRASTQPLYDCVNVATVNALNARNANNRNNVHNQQSEQRQQQEFYSCPNAPENDYEIEIIESEAPTNPDKVTRF